MKNNQRPNPQDLLDAVQKLEEQRQRGSLRIFLGMCPGVGKTYSMLKAAREQLGRGVKITVGVVETHGRRETQELLEGFPQISKKKLDYKGSTLLEMDLDEILKQKPQIVLVDELAHTNAPGSRHLKRYQDVEEILDAGINVYTTLNIQHIESRNDQVAQIAAVQVRETVPDSFLEKADQIELIDLSPRELLHRLREGKVYLGEGAERAVQNFFKEEHLTALRELALRFTAEKVDQDLSEQMLIKGIEGPWNTNERLLVAVSYSPYSSRLIRATRRMAYNLEAPWIALYVDTGAALDNEDQSMLQKNLALARELGAEVITISNPNLNEAIQYICAEKNVTQIVMGRPDRRFLRDFVTGGTLLDQLVRTTSKIDVHVIRAQRKPRYRGFHLQWPERSSILISYYYTAWFLAVVSFLSYLVLPYLGYQAMGSVFLLAILVVASFASRGPIIFAAMVSALTWDYFFIPPQFTFDIHSHQDFVMLATFFVAALVGGYLTTKIRRQEKALVAREKNTHNLYELGKNLSEAKNLDGIALVLTGTIERQLESESLVLLLKDKKLELNDFQRSKITEKELAVAQWTLENSKSAGWSTPTLSASQCLCTPMKANTRTVGVLVLYPNKKLKTLSIEQENFLQSVVSHVSIAIERLQFREAMANAKIFEASEKLHQTLLNSISHELRTPITTIMGSATALKDEVTMMNASSRVALVEGLVQSAKRLDRVVENLLDMTRIEKGPLQLKKEWFQIEDLIRETVSEMKNEFPHRKIEFFGDMSTLIEGDFRLLKHAVSNLVLNALRYSSEKSTVEIQVQKESRFTHISVCDHGAGIPEDKIPHLFEKFYRLPGTPAGGLGLGLSIVKNIIELHDGAVSVKNRAQETGAIFEIKLPIKTEPIALQEIVQ